MNRNGMRCRKITPNEPGTVRDWRSTGGRSIGVGVNMNSAIEHSLILLVMYCCSCVRCMAAPCFPWNRSKRSNRLDVAKEFAGAGATIATTRRTVEKYGDCSDTSAICLVCASIRKRHVGHPIRVHAASKQPKPIALQVIAMKL